MSYQQTKKVTDVEKRLEALKRELYGKEKPVYIAPKLNQTPSIEIANQLLAPLNPSNKSDVYYLNNDLKKILILATLAISTQVLLFLQFNNHLFKFN
jgi:hypothetical protein